MPYQATSRAAYETAKLGERQQQVYDHFKAADAAGANGLTNLEISAAIPLPINIVCGRTNELVQKGLVIDSGLRRESVFRKLNIVWRLANKLERADAGKAADPQLALL